MSLKPSSLDMIATTNVDIHYILRCAEAESLVVTVCIEGNVFTGRPSFLGRAAFSEEGSWWQIDPGEAVNIVEVRESAIESAKIVPPETMSGGWIPAKDVPESWCDRLIEWRYPNDPSSIVMLRRSPSGTSEFGLSTLRCRGAATMLVRLAALPEAPSIDVPPSEPTFRCQTCKDEGTVVAEDAESEVYGSLCRECLGRKPQEPVWSMAGVRRSDDEMWWTAWHSDIGGKIFEFVTNTGRDDVETVAIDMRRLQFINVGRVHGERCHEMSAARVLASLNSGELKP